MRPPFFILPAPHGAAEFRKRCHLTDCTMPRNIYTLYIFIYIYIHIYIHIFLGIYISAESVIYHCRIRIYIYIYICIYMTFMSLPLYIEREVYRYIYTYIHICVYTYICIYTYIHLYRYICMYVYHCRISKLNHPWLTFLLIQDKTLLGTTPEQNSENFIACLLLGRVQEMLVRNNQLIIVQMTT